MALIKVEEALEIILDNIRSLQKAADDFVPSLRSGTVLPQETAAVHDNKLLSEANMPFGSEEFEKVAILEALDRVLAEEIFSDEDIPPFDNSAMDGYAVIASDTKGASASQPAVLEVVEELPAGYEAAKVVKNGEAIKIMTGAPMPKGADAVVMVEDTKLEDSRALIFKEISPGDNVRRAGEDVKKGDKVLQKGTLIRPAEIGMLAALGKPKITVVRKPRVAILSTGDELVDIGEKLSPGKIRNSNTYSLYAQIKRLNCIPIDMGIAKDVSTEVKEKIQDGLASADMILISGGVSVGEYDLVKDVLIELGIDMKFWKVAMKPGKPMLFGIIDSKPVFGLPGNPVSVMISFEQFVRPALLKMSGRSSIRKPIFKAILDGEIRQKLGRKNFIRAWIEPVNGNYHAKITGPQGSGILRSMTLANGLIIVPEDISHIQTGAEVNVQFFDSPEVD